MINVAIVGAGIGAEHLAAYRTLPEHFNVKTIVDQNVDRAENLRQINDVYDVQADVAHALADSSIDLIDICLPPHLHAEFTIQALQAGKQVICEKPLATNIEETEKIQTAAREADKRVFPVFQYRWGPATAQLASLVQSGITGKPYVASLETHWNRGPDYYDIPWRGTWAGEQGGAVLCHAIHSHDLLSHYMGPIRSVSAITTTRVNEIETEDCAVLNFELENGALATSCITLGAATDETRLRFVFENLTATSNTSPYAPGLEPWTFIARDPSLQPKVDEIVNSSEPEPVGFAGFLQSVAYDLALNLQTSVKLEEGCASVALVTAIYDAARTGKRVSLPLAKDHVFYGGWTP